MPLPNDINLANDGFLAAVTADLYSDKVVESILQKNPLITSVLKQAFIDDILRYQELTHWWQFWERRKLEKSIVAHCLYFQNEITETFEASFKLKISRRKKLNSEYWKGKSAKNPKSR